MKKWTAEEMMRLYLKAIERFGEGAQIMKAIEEFAELTQALCKAAEVSGNTDPEILDGICEHLAEEMADAQIMLHQLLLIFRNTGAMSDWTERKLDRLEARLSDEG